MRQKSQTVSWPKLKAILRRKDTSRCPLIRFKLNFQLYLMSALSPICCSLLFATAIRNIFTYNSSFEGHLEHILYFYLLAAKCQLNNR